ncbi:MAG: restriction endonuclease [Deltaproteobacteria bacterium]|nr:restriction endonuclease [Deltaproteobacteria bacterium]
MPVRDLLKEIEKEVDLDDWAKERYGRSGNVRWESISHLMSIYYVKAGYLVRKGGIWHLTPEGEEALKLGADRLFEQAKVAYAKWKSEQPDTHKDETVAEPTAEILPYELIEQRAIEGLEKFINAKNPYEFQYLVAAMLRGMGYYTPFVAPKGKDGGVDIVAYRDPLGTESPRIQIQIKHRQSAAPVQEVRQLMGLLQKEGDVGIFVSTGGFSPEARAAARSSHVHVELIDLHRFINLWREFYNKLKDEDKSLLPLRPIYFLATSE